jgi:regulatory protein
MTQASSMTKPRAELLASLRFKAMNLLARREHSQQELLAKLSKTGADEPTLLEVIKRLIEQGLQSDERFAEAFVRARRQKGYGPSRIFQELKIRGLEDDIIDQALDYSTADSFEQAFVWAQRRYSALSLDDPKVYRRAYAALARRGFCAEVIGLVLKSLKHQQ